MDHEQFGLHLALKFLLVLRHHYMLLRWAPPQFPTHDSQESSRSSVKKEKKECLLRTALSAPASGPDLGRTCGSPEKNQKRRCTHDWSHHLPYCFSHWFFQTLPHHQVAGGTETSAFTDGQNTMRPLTDLQQWICLTPEKPGLGLGFPTGNMVWIWHLGAASQNSLRFKITLIF